MRYDRWGYAALGNSIEAKKKKKLGTAELEIRRNRHCWFYSPAYKPILDSSLRILVTFYAIAGCKTSLFGLTAQVAKEYEIRCCLVTG